MDCQPCYGGHLMDLAQALSQGGDVATMGIMLFLWSHQKDIKNILTRLTKIEEKLWPRH